MVRYAAMDLVRLTQKWLKDYKQFLKEFLTLVNNDGDDNNGDKNNDDNNQVIQHIVDFLSTKYHPCLKQFQELNLFYVQYIDQLPLPPVFTGDHIPLEWWSLKYGFDIYSRAENIVHFVCLLEKFFEKPQENHINITKLNQELQKVNQQINEIVATWDSADQNSSHIRGSK